ncbi:MAG: hypothetical protein JRH20_14630 [Deltaproteobacteria bacterium]|nr:hypothetical protein [Deltaproteobacteria bacterium]
MGGSWRASAAHPNGYLREALIGELDQLNDDGVISFLLMRINDWVAPIRACALAAMRRRLKPRYADALFSALPLVNKLGHLQAGGPQRLPQGGLRVSTFTGCDTRSEESSCPSGRRCTLARLPSLSRR